MIKYLLFEFTIVDKVELVANCDRLVIPKKDKSVVFHKKANELRNPIGFKNRQRLICFTHSFIII